MKNNYEKQQKWWHNLLQSNKSKTQQASKAHLSCITVSVTSEWKATPKTSCNGAVWATIAVHTVVEAAVFVWRFWRQLSNKWTGERCNQQHRTKNAAYKWQTNVMSVHQKQDTTHILKYHWYSIQWPFTKISPILQGITDSMQRYQYWNTYNPASCIQISILGKQRIHYLARALGFLTRCAI